MRKMEVDDKTRHKTIVFKLFIPLKWDRIK